MQDTKRCPDCGVAVHYRGLGRPGRCQSCRAEAARRRKERRDVATRAWRLRNRDRELEKARARSRANRKAETARHRRYVERNRERMRKYERQRRRKDTPRDRVRRAAATRKRRARWTAEQRAAQAAYLKAWNQRNRGKVREYSRRGQLVRRARKHAGFVEVVDPAEVLRRGDGLCGICGKPVDPETFHVDHIVPLALGGEHSYANTQAAHPLCNRSKGTKLPTGLSA